MNAKILDRRKDGESTCYLCRISLNEYINGLDNTYQDYDIQREIVSNVYLDTLVNTVIQRRHIPPIVLVVDKKKCTDKSDFLQVSTFKILDGLQRTFRLQTIRKTIEFCHKNLDQKEDYNKWNKFKFSRTFSAQLREFDSNTEVLRPIAELFHTAGKDGIEASFTENFQWFEIWVGLSPKEEVSKMLTLNAGHKPVKTRHQLELLFLNLLPVLREGEGSDFTLVREKETSSTQFSKDRKSGHFHFAHIITSLLSLSEATPVPTTTGLIQDLQSDAAYLDSYSEITDPTFLKEFVKFLVKIDRQLTSQYKEHGTLWVGREVSLAGIFGAIGAVAKNSGEDRAREMKRFADITRANPTILNLEQFEKVRNSLDLSKINIGNVNRKAVFDAVKELLSIPTPATVDWRKHFRVEAK